MQNYIIRRLILIIPTIWILTLVVFGIMRVLPGDVAIMLLTDETGAATATRFTVERLREQLGLNRPLYIQYLEWLWDMARGDFGLSLYNDRPVQGEIMLRMPITFQLTVLGMGLSLVLGIPVGVLSAVKQNSWLDYTLRFWSVFFLAAPGFWLALLVILVGSLVFTWSPPAGYRTLWEDPTGNMLQLLWPSIILGLNGMATMARMTRSTMLEVMREDYIRTARAKGLGEQVVIIRHALKNALIPVVTLAGLQFGTLMGGAVILEAVFGIPGIGTLFINSIRVRDYTLVQGIVVVFAVVFMFTNLVIDLAYGWLDPRISYG